MNKAFFSAAMLTLIFGCKLGSKGSGGAGSDASSININLPPIQMINPLVRNSIRDYDLKMVPSGANCVNGRNVAVVRVYGEKISDKLTQGCDYTIGLKLVSSDSTPYYGNWESNLALEGKKLAATDFLNKSAINISITLRPLKAAIDAGVKKDENLQTPSDTDANLCVEIEGQKSANPECKSDSGDKSTSVVGSCEKDDANFKTDGGGCMFLQTKVIFSSIANSNGTVTQMPAADAPTYCDNLVESGYSDWSLPSDSDIKSLFGRSPQNILNNFSKDASAGGFYYTSTLKGSERVTVQLGGSATSSASSSKYFVVCVRK